MVLEVYPQPDQGLEHLHILPTPPPCTHRMLDTIEVKGTVLECCAGTNSITRVLRSRGLKVTASDILWERPTDPYTRDATRDAFWQNIGPHDWVITNPPFTMAVSILTQAWQHCRLGVVFLLRLSFSEPCEDREDLLLRLADHQILHMPLNPRPIFRLNSQGKPGQEAVTVAWFGFRKDFSYQQFGIQTPFQYLYGWSYGD